MDLKGKNDKKNNGKIGDNGEKRDNRIKKCRQKGTKQANWKEKGFKKACKRGLRKCSRKDDWWNRNRKRGRGRV
jgi:hypothetical protein